MSDLAQRLAGVPRLDIIGPPTPLEHLPRLSDFLARDIFIKRDDLTPLGLGGNKLRKLEYLAADALRQGADTLLTAGAIQSNHVRQTAALAAKLGLHCVALLEKPIDTPAGNYLTNGNRLLLDLFQCEVIACEALTQPAQQLADASLRLEAQGFRPYVIPVGGSNALGSLGYVGCALEIAHQCQGVIQPGAVVVSSGSGGTHAGLEVGLAAVLPETAFIGVTVSRRSEQQRPLIASLAAQVSEQLSLAAPAAEITLWDEYFAPGYGQLNDEGREAIALLARLEGIVLDPVYAGKAMAGLIDGLERDRFPDGPLVCSCIPAALFAYHYLETR
ncbi:D-cysteine desulfhydrase [Sodalis glossinidius str. 'morsitans']|uniref:L-cysteate sulfo-lyase n=1 Tax=Sodalis glossinidius (strain morsitans) TaxID=343509 RepID=Q2NUI9_SODGM|nr:D-cysteine desulfhydrase [Sodalis glossinidius]BAE74186.1 putative 1-aminocyclopropane-1-carboxylate deaminase [Sodalis glossinidius str. 'morsitans']CRL44748.1 D-cysteine desulfhydrase [Sodalis glossinidius str. 'morsitans']